VRAVLQISPLNLTPLRRELTALEEIRILGYKPVHPDTLQPSFVELPAQLAYTGERGLKSPLQVARLVIPQALVEIEIIHKINQYLRKRHSAVSRSEKSRYVPTSAKEWWCFFAQLLRKRLLKQGKDPKLSAEELKKVDAIIPPHRFTALKEAHCFMEEEIQSLGEALCKNLRTVVALGNFGVVDETMIAHFSHGMRVDGIDMCIPTKPHPYGLLVYGLVQPLLFSGAPLLIDSDPRIPSHKVTPVVAFDILVKRNFNSPVHIYADCAFGAPVQASSFRRTLTKVTISFGEGAPANLAQLRQISVPDLAISTSRTFSAPHFTIQVTAGEAHPTCVLSTFWGSSAAPPAPPVDPNMLAHAHALYSSDMSDDAIKAVLGINPALQSGPRHEYIAAHFGVKLHLPSAGPCGLLLTKENLNEIGKPLLVILLQETPGASGGSAKKKRDIIKEILRHHPAAEPRLNVAEWQAEKRSVLQVRAQVLGIPTQASPITDKYKTHYGLLDRHDRYLYQVFGTAGFTNWNTCLVLTHLFQQMINAHTLNKEQCARAAHPARAESPVPRGVSRHLKCAEFVGAVIRELIDE